MSVKQVNKADLLAKLERMGITAKAKYCENHAVLAVEAFTAYNDTLNDECEGSEDSILTYDELAFIVMEFAGCKS